MKPLLKSNLLYSDKTRRKLFVFTCFEHFPSVRKVRWPKSVTLISILLTAISICSRQFQFYSRQFQSAHGHFNLLTAISICSRPFQLRQFQFYSRRFQYTHGNFAILLKAISIFARQRPRHFSLLSPPVSYGGRQWPRTKSQNAKSKVDS